MYEHFWKRLIDIVLSSIGIIVVAIPMLIIALIIKIDSPGPVFFKQKRVGINKTNFTIIKFRSMPITVPKDTPTHQFKAEDMLSKWQKFMRKSSLDELPQFFCIWLSKMSIVGPRPALWNQDDLVAERDKYGANDVKPGLTGWAQVNGRNAITWDEKFELDVWYVEHISFSLDAKIVWQTVKAVLHREGISAESSATMEAFTGTKEKEENVLSH